MPSVFRRRFLSYQDVLDPSEMNQDYQPFVELLSGNIDSDNLKASSLKAVDPGSEAGHRMESMSNCVPYYSEIVCHPRFEIGSDDAATHARGSRHPNFLHPSSDQPLYTVAEEDSYTLKSDYQGFRATNLQTLSAGSGWTPLAGGEDMIPRGEIDGIDQESERSVDLTITTKKTTGESKLWITAFAQYVRNGFGWSGQEDYTHMDDTDYDPTSADVKPAKRPLNIFYIPGPKEEAYYPSRCGLHHLSQGYTSANVQFAIRLNGQVLEETITGKRFELERSSLGARHRKTLERNTNADTSDKTFPSTPSIYKLPGPAQKQIRATALGPEMLGVRLGTIVSVGPGPHTIEIVARKLTMTSKNTNMPFDVVGVHNRQLFVMEMPINRSIDASHSGVLSQGVLEKEDSVSSDTLLTGLSNLGNAANSIEAAHIRPGSLRNTHLQSKVVTTDLALTGVPDVGIPHLQETNSTFHADDNWSRWQSLSTLHSATAECTTTDSAAGCGWFTVNGEADHLKVHNTDSSGSRIDIDDDSVLMVQVDLQHVRIEANGSVPLKHHLLDLFAGYAIGHREWTSQALTGAPGSTGSGASTQWRMDQASRVYINSWNPSGRTYEYKIVDDGTATHQFATDQRVDEDVARDNYFNVSLMFVVGDKQRRRDPDGNFWKIGEVGLFFAGSASFRDLAEGPTWKDHYWDQGTSMGIVLSTPMRTYRSTDTWSMSPPTIKHGRGTMSLIHIKK